MDAVRVGLSKKLQRQKSNEGYEALGYFGFVVTEIKVLLAQEGPVVEKWTDDLTCALVLVQNSDEISQWARVAGQFFQADQVLWFAYPKKSSKMYAGQIDRDHGWKPLQDLGFEPVRQVALDEDWSALRFRRRIYIKNFTRKPETWGTSH